MSNEQTLSIIKPDAVERNLADDIKNIFKNNNLKIIESKKIHISKDEAAEFYKVHQSKPFFNDLCAYLSSSPIVVMISCASARMADMANGHSNRNHI